MVIKFREGDMDYGVEVTGRYIPSPSISYRNRSLVDNLHPLLEKSQIVISDPFDSSSKEIIFIPGVAEFCNKIFDLIIKIKARHGGNYQYR
jgi:hypothetical protein